MLPPLPRVYCLASVLCSCLDRTLSLKSLKPFSLFVCVYVHTHAWMGVATIAVVLLTVGLKLTAYGISLSPQRQAVWSPIRVGKRLIGKEKRWKAQRTLMLQLRYVGFFFFLKGLLPFCILLCYFKENTWNVKTDIIGNTRFWLSALLAYISFLFEFITVVSHRGIIICSHVTKEEVRD